MAETVESAAMVCTTSRIMSEECMSRVSLVPSAQRRRANERTDMRACGCRDSDCGKMMQSILCSHAHYCAGSMSRDRLSCQSDE